MALVAAGVILSFQCIQNYVIDAFTLHAASGMCSVPSNVRLLSWSIVLSALAAVSFLRSLCGFGFPLFAPAMYQALGFGKGDTILAVVAIIIGCPAYVYHATLPPRRVLTLFLLTDRSCSGSMVNGYDKQANTRHNARGHLPPLRSHELFMIRT